MPITYDKLLTKLKSKGITSYTLKKIISLVKLHIRKSKMAEVLIHALSQSSANSLNVSPVTFWSMWKNRIRLNQIQ